MCILKDEREFTRQRRKLRVKVYTKALRPGRAWSCGEIRSAMGQEQ